jgi:hypothetical protein
MRPRRDFFGHMAGAVALGIAGAAPTPLLAQAVAPSDGPDWPGVLKGRHRQVVDAYRGHGMGGQRDPGDHRHPVGNLGVNRAQENGCSYCAGG